MPDKSRQRKMVNIDIAETSGVDHPAHLQEGWMILKSADSATVNKLFGVPDATNKEGAPMPSIDENVKPEELDAEKEAAEKAAAEKEAAEKAGNPFGDKSDPTKDDIIASLRAEIKELKSKVGKSADTEEDLIEKSALPTAVKEFMAKQTEELAKAREDFAKERDARLDADAIAKSRETYTTLGIQHEDVAPALRRVSVFNPELAKSVETVLKAADAQLAESGLFKEAGKTAQPEGNTALEMLNKQADKLLADGVATSRSDAFTKALSMSEELSKTYINESAGK